MFTIIVTPTLIVTVLCAALAIYAAGGLHQRWLDARKRRRNRTILGWRP